MEKIIKEVIIKNSQGLHARPAAMFVQVASKYNSNVSIQKDGEKVNGKSIMGILTLGAKKDSKVILEANGDDANALISELEELLTKDHI